MVFVTFEATVIFPEACKSAPCATVTLAVASVKKSPTAKPNPCLTDSNHEALPIALLSEVAFTLIVEDEKTWEFVPNVISDFGDQYWIAIGNERRFG